MPENNKTQEFLQKLAPCIERSDLDACVEEAVRVAREMGVGAGELLELSGESGKNTRYDFTYVLVLAAAQGLEGEAKAVAYYNAGFAAKYLGKVEKAEEQYKQAIAANLNLADAYYNYANLLKELNRKTEAEEQYKQAIAANPNIAEAHSNYANLLYELNRKTEAEEQYKQAIASNPNLVEAHSNYANLLSELNGKTEAEEHYQQAITTNPNFAAAHYNYANLLKELNRKTEAEEQYKQAIAANLNYAAAHSNYAILLKELNRKTEAEEHYLQAITFNPNYAEAHYNYANLLSELNRKPDAEEHYKQAIAANPNLAEAHGAYGLLLIKFNKRKDAKREIERASGIFREAGQITKSHLARAWFYEEYSEKNFHMKKFRESGEDAEKAGKEYLNASETTQGDLNEKLALQGNVLKAKSFVRKIPVKSWYRKILNRFGKNPDISELMDNLGEAAKYYEKASCCSAGERKDICSACFSSIRVFSEILHAMNALIQNDDVEIEKNKWSNSLELAHKIYTEKKLNNGAALVDTLKQLIKCVDELAEHRKVGLRIQEERLGKCYNNLLEVSEKLDGALKIITEHSVEAIRDYAEKQGMGFIGEEIPKKSFLGEWIKEIRAAAAVIIAAAIVDWIFSLNLLSRFISIIKPLFWGTP